MRLLMLGVAMTLFATLPALADHHTQHGEMGGHAMMAGATMPEDGAVLEASPEQIMIQFGHAMTPQMVRLTTLTGEVIDLDLGERAATDHLMLAVPELQPDDYTIDWRAAGANGHVMSGSFSFTVK
jgi:methionine-rich copper-binding protein CopC